MKTIIVACGAGVATSTMICKSITDLMEKNDISFQIIQCSLNEINSYIDNANLIVASTPLKIETKVPFILGIPLIAGINSQETEQEILKCLA